MGRLFWKIFLWFWLAMLAMGSTVALTVYLYVQAHDQDPEGPLAHFARDKVTLVATVLKHGGVDATREVLSMKSNHPMQVLVVDQQGKELLGREIPIDEMSPIVEHTVLAPDQKSYRVFIGMPAWDSFWKHRQHQKRKHGPSILLKVLVVVLVSGMFCWGLAWYLSRPLRHLRDAVRRFGEGELDTRLGERWCRVRHKNPLRLKYKRHRQCRDEIFELGQDFDQMAERLQALVFSHRQLLHDVSHELRSPLARLQVAMELARRNPQEMETALQRIEREAGRLEDLVGQVLILARLDSGQQPECADYVDMAALLEDLVDDARFEAGDDGPKVVCELESQPTLKVNAELLHRALENVLRNALRHSPDGGEVSVSLKADAQNWNISICDQGPGVAEDRLDDLFEAFVRIDSARSRSDGGFGLGLAIARRAIEAHGGSIRAANQSSGGLCIEMALPKEALDGPALK